MNSGKALRLSRIMQNQKMLCVPLDHGITDGPLSNLSKFRYLAEAVIDGGATAIIVHKGMVRFLPTMSTTGLVIHLSASTSLSGNIVNKCIVCGVEEALSLGADAVSVHINVGNAYEQQMITDLANISKQCVLWGMPLLAMMYVRNENNDDVMDLSKTKHAVRIAEELGVDVIKIAYPGCVKSLKEVVSCSEVPIVIAGGRFVTDQEQLLNLSAELVGIGIAGLSFGRNVFCHHDPKYIIEKLHALLFSD